MNIAFVPVRGGSKSIPFKNIKEFCGRPLVYWCLEELNKAKSIDLIVVASDCDQILSIVEKLNYKKLSTFKRSKENASDTSTTESVVLEYLENCAHNENDLFLLVQATSPFTRAIDFEKSIKHLLDTRSDSLVSCVRSKRFIWNKKGFPENYQLADRPRRQEFDGYMIENGAFYINTVGNFLSSGLRVSGKIVLYEMNEINAIEIDEEIDWLIAEKLMIEMMTDRISVKPLKIKMFLSDVDGTLTDAGMYYGDTGEKLKKFNTRDGKAFELLRKKGIKTGIITSENSKIVEKRAKKLKIDYLYQGRHGDSKLEAAIKICKQESILLSEVAYIGDDINCYELLNNVGFPACPSDAVPKIKDIANITILCKKGGDGCVREFVDNLI